MALVGDAGHILNVIIWTNRCKQLAFSDSLTKLPNRRLLDDRINQAIAASAPNWSVWRAECSSIWTTIKPLNDTRWAWGGRFAAG